MRVRVVHRAGFRYRVGVPTPYFVQSIADELRRARGVEIELPADADADAVAGVRDAFALVRAPSIRVVRARSGAAA